jgi:hypothetical protein
LYCSRSHAWTIFVFTDSWADNRIGRIGWNNFFGGEAKELVLQQGKENVLDSSLLVKGATCRNETCDGGGIGLGLKQEEYTVVIIHTIFVII